MKKWALAGVLSLYTHQAAFEEEEGLSETSITSLWRASVSEMWVWALRDPGGCVVLVCDGTLVACLPGTWCDSQFDWPTFTSLFLLANVMSSEQKHQVVVSGWWCT